MVPAPNPASPAALGPHQGEEKTGATLTAPPVGVQHSIARPTLDVSPEHNVAC